MTFAQIMLGLFAVVFLIGVIAIYLDIKRMDRFLPALALCILPLFASSCALIRPGDDPIVVRTQDVISNSFDAWDVAMDLHAANSTRESPQVYAAAEKIRTGFPQLHRALRNALKGYQGATTKDAEKLRLAVIGILGDIEALAPPGSKFAQTVALIRASYLGGGA